MRLLTQVHVVGDILLNVENTCEVAKGYSNATVRPSVASL